MYTIYTYKIEVIFKISKGILGGILGLGPLKAGGD